MKTLIINGSPRENGDTAFLLSKLKETIHHEVIDISAYRDKIAPCKDCRYCKQTKGCSVKDKMDLIYADDFDNVIIASPIYMSGLTPPLVGIASRFQAVYCAKRFLGDEFHFSPKKAALILVGGGDGSPSEAIRLSSWMFRKMNAKGYEKHMVFSLNTDEIPAKRDIEAIEKVQEIALYLNGNRA